MPQKARSLWIPTLLLLLIFSLPLLLCSQDKSEPPVTGFTNPTLSRASPQLIEEEKLAKQAVFEEVKADDSSYSSTVSEHMKRLIALMNAVGDREGVRQLEPLVHEYYIDEFASEIAPAKTRDDFHARLEAAEKIEEDYRRDDALRFMIEQELELHFFEDAIGAAARLTSLLDRTRALDKISTAYRKAGDTRRAQDFLNQAIAAGAIPDHSDYPTLPDQRLEEIAHNHQADGDEAGARLALAKLLEWNAGVSAEYQDLAKTDAARIYSQIGDYRRAHQLIDSVHDDSSISRTEDYVLYEQAVTANPRRGLALAQKVQEGWSRASVFVEIARKQSDSNDSAGASATLHKALRDARDLDQFRGTTMAKIALAWADFGNIQQAGQILEEALEMEKEQPTADGDRDAEYIAVVFAEMGDFTRALELARQLDEESSYTYGHIALEEVEAGQLQHVLDWVSSLKTPEAKAEVLLNVCDALAPEK